MDKRFTIAVEDLRDDIKTVLASDSKTGRRLTIVVNPPTKSTIFVVTVKDHPGLELSFYDLKEAVEYFNEVKPTDNRAVYSAWKSPS